MTTSFTLGLDLGGSRSKWHLLRGTQTAAHGDTPPLTAATLLTPQGLGNLQALVQALPARPDRVHAGLPGYGPSRPDQAALRDQLTSALGLRDDQLTLESDLDLAFRAHLHRGQGVLLYAGTGSVAYHVTADGTVLRAGGHGYHIDDDGAGYALGRGALRWLTRELDQGCVPVGPLASAVRSVTGELDWETLRHFAYGTPGAGNVARLAPAVGQAADAGDVAAQAIAQQVALHLADLASTVLRRLPERVPVVATGGALRTGAFFTSTVRRALPGLTVQFRDHAQAAAWEAARRDL